MASLSPSRLAVLTTAAASLALVTKRVKRRDTRAIDERLAAITGIRERGADRVSVFAEPRAIALETVAIASLPALSLQDRAFVVAAPLASDVVAGALLGMGAATLARVVVGID